jgi:hypothetical protein
MMNLVVLTARAAGDFRVNGGERGIFTGSSQAMG